jgi:hypothetical protein
MGHVGENPCIFNIKNSEVDEIQYDEALWPLKYYYVSRTANIITLF